REFTKVCTSSWVAYWVRYGLILRMLNSAKRQDLETEAMWSVKVSWSSIMTPRFRAVLDGTRDKVQETTLTIYRRGAPLCLAYIPFMTAREHEKFSSSSKLPPSPLLVTTGHQSSMTITCHSSFYAV